LYDLENAREQNYPTNWLQLEVGNMMNMLTDYQAEELRHRPLGPKYFELDREQLETRRRIAQKWFRELYSQDSAIDDDTLKLYERFPVDNFYVDVQDDRPVRVYGFNTETQEVLVFDRMLQFSSLPFDEISRVEGWADDQRADFLHAPAGGYMVDPIGPLAFMFTTANQG
jgi:hypothetical protein